MEVDNGLPASLRSARTIARLFVGGSEDTLTKVRDEQQRINRELTEMGIMELLSSVQALIIYLLMRISGGASEDEQDVDLNRTLIRVCSRILALPNFHERLSKFPPWKQWIIIESKRRVNSVLRLMWQLYNLDVGLPCPCLHTYKSMPLPASKLLWNAASEEEWQRELENDAFYRSKSHQDLIDFRCGSKTDQPTGEEWARWYAGTDELGILVVLSTSLI
jgi:hypothetical protein